MICKSFYIVYGISFFENQVDRKNLEFCEKIEYLILSLSVYSIPKNKRQISSIYDLLAPTNCDETIQLYGNKL